MDSDVKNTIELMSTSTKGMDGWSGRKYLNIARLNNHIFNLEQRIRQLEYRIGR